MTVEGATDAEVFRTYVQRVLCPALRPADIVIMDNLCPHKNALTLLLIELVCLMWLQFYLKCSSTPSQ